VIVMSVPADTVFTVDSAFDQINARDAALLSWLAVLLVWVVWGLVRRSSLSDAAIGIVRALAAVKVWTLVLSVMLWLSAIVYLAAQVGLWDTRLMKDTVVIVLVGGLTAGFKALDHTTGKSNWRTHLRSLATLVVVVQFVSNLEPFPYLVELALVPLAVLLGGVQAVASGSDEYRSARGLINGLIITLGLAILSWSAYRVLASIGTADWDKIGKSFALAFWLPAALVPAVYLVALAMQYGQIFLMMRSVRRPSLVARLDLYLHHGLSLRRLRAFSQTPGRAREYARTMDRAERRELLQVPLDDLFR
jgi:hypothetical protein